MGDSPARLDEISIHPPLAGRDKITVPDRWPMTISIHPPLAERDRVGHHVQDNRVHFNPPAPCGAGRGYPCGWFQH